MRLLTSLTLSLNEQTLCCGLVTSDDDCNEYRPIEEVINDAVTRYDELVSLIPVGVYIVWIRANGHFDFEYVSDRWCAIHCLNREDVLADADVVNDLVHPDDRERFLESNRKALRGHQPFQWEGRYFTGDGRLLWLRIESAPAVFEDGDVRFFGVTQDITERKQSEQEIQELLAERDLLIREIQHRIKNNINTMSSLISLQAQSLEHPAAVAALEEAGNRLSSLGVLYDHLYAAGSHGQASLQQYLRQLMSNEIQVFPRGSDIDVHFQFDECMCTAKTLSTLGLIVNELVTNAMKYAFKDHPKPRLSLIGAHRGDYYSLTLKDNGPGILGPAQRDGSSGFGFMVVDALVEQLNGTIHFEDDGGTRIRLEFPVIRE